MKYLIVLLVLSAAQPTYANMASPIWEGTSTGSVFSSRDIDILGEHIRLSIDEDFQTATYHIAYRISCDSGGTQIPLLFDARDYREGFNIWVDDQQVPVLNVPKGHLTTTNTPYQKFSNAFGREEGQTAPNVTLTWDNGSVWSYQLDDLQYFELDLAPGEHLIRIIYTADAWIDHADWVKSYSFRYALLPAKYWRSFNSLEIELDSPKANGHWSTSLGAPDEGAMERKAVWRFSNLPADYFTISFQPAINNWAKAMIAIGPLGLTLVLLVVLTFFHVLLIRTFRNRHPLKKYSWAVILGSIAVPFITLVFFMFSFGIIDLVIGQHAGSHHGYVFFILLLYPALLPIYWIIMWQIDRHLKNKLHPNPLT